MTSGRFVPGSASESNARLHTSEPSDLSALQTSSFLVTDQILSIKVFS